MLGENNTVLNLKGLLRTSGKRAKSPGPRMDEVHPWLLFRFVLTHCWLSEEDSKRLGTTTMSGEPLAAAQEKKIMLTQRHLSGVNSVTGTLWPPCPPVIHTGSAPTAHGKQEMPPPVLSLQCGAPALLPALPNRGGREESAERRGRSPVSWVTFVLGEINHLLSKV